MSTALPKRKSLRLKYYDYNTPGAYFVTICTEHRQCHLSRIVGGGVPDAPNPVQLLPYGKIAEKYIHQLNEFYDNIRIDQYVIMPNHIHLLLFVLDNNKIEDESGAPRTTPPTPRTASQFSVVSAFVSTFKRFCNKEYGKNIWQRYFYDHVIQHEKDYQAHIQYILENPLRWHPDELYTQE